jgi:hypothetical protein
LASWGRRRIARPGFDWLPNCPYNSAIFAAEAQMSNVHVSTHPLVRHKLTMLRRVETESKKFRELVRELAIMLCYEATADLGLDG